MNKRLITVTAPEDYNELLYMPSINVFLSGGITGCPDWHSEVISHLWNMAALYDFENVYVFNPKRQSFDVSDTKATIEQIRWEHKWLEHCDLFTCFFSGRTDSVQPITLYEMGKYSRNKPCVISVEDGYKRKDDVLIQTALDGIHCNVFDRDESTYEHARAIAVAIEKLQKERRND